MRNCAVKNQDGADIRVKLHRNAIFAG